MPSLDDLVAQHNPTKPLSLDEALAKQAPQESSFQPTQYGFKVRPSTLPDSGQPATQREDGAFNSPGTQDWKFFDPATKVYVPAPSAPFSQNGLRDAASFNGRNLKAGWNAAMDGLYGLGSDVGHVTGLLSDKDYVSAIQRVEQAQKERQAMRNQGGWQATGLQGAGQAAPIVMATAAGTPAIAAALPAASLAPIAAPLAMGGATYAMTPGTQEERVHAGELAAAAGPLTEFGIDKVVKPAVGIVRNAVSGKLPAAAQAIADLGDRFGVRTLAPDLAANQPGLAKSAVLAESIPGSGMVGQRVAQQQEAQAAAQKLLAQHGIEGEVPTTIQQSLQNNLASVKGTVRSAYDKVAQLAEGKGDVPLDQTLKSIQQAKAAEASAVVPDQGLIGLLDKMETRLTDPKAGVDLSYTGVRGLRSDLGSMISDYYKGTNATTGSKGVQVLQGVKGALEGDLSNFTAANGPELATAAKQADSLYKSQLVPLKDRVIVTATKNSEPDQIYKAIVAAGPDRAQKFYGALDPNGQAAVRAQMVQNAYSDATQTAGVFSPAKFAQSLEKIKDSTGVFFKGQDKFELDGFTNLMRAVQRAGQVNENPPTGNRLLMGLLGGEAVHGVGSVLGHGPEALAGAAATAGLTVGGARALTSMFSSNLGKRLLLAASEAPVGSKMMTDLVETQLPKVVAASVPKASNISPLRTLSPAASTEPNSTLAENK